MSRQCTRYVASAATAFGAVVLTAGTGFAAPVPGPASPTPCSPSAAVVGGAPEVRLRSTADPGRADCTETAAPGRPGSVRPGSVRPPRHAGKPTQGAGTAERAREKRSTDRGRAAKQAVHDGPVVVARRAITTRLAAAGAEPVWPLGLAAGAFLLAGGALVIGARRRAHADAPGGRRPR